MKDSLFDYLDYKKYLIEKIRSFPKAGRGYRKALSEAAQCQTAYLSHVLNGNAHLNLDQAEAIGRYLGQNQNEKQFFLFLVEHNRSGSAHLKSFLLSQMLALKTKHQMIRERVNVTETLTREDQSRYYSIWYYCAIHMMLTLPRFQTKEAISKYLELSITRVSDVLEFFVTRGLAVEHSGRFKTGKSSIHLENDSPLISKHHTNWRVQAIRALESENSQSLHFSSVVTISKRDFKKIRSILLESIEQSIKLVKDSKEEKLCAILMDFFCV